MPFRPAQFDYERRLRGMRIGRVDARLPTHWSRIVKGPRGSTELSGWSDAPMQLTENVPTTTCTVQRNHGCQDVR